MHGMSVGESAGYPKSLMDIASLEELPVIHLKTLTISNKRIIHQNKLNELYVPRAPLPIQVHLCSFMARGAGAFYSQPFQLTVFIILY